VSASFQKISEPQKRLKKNLMNFPIVTDVPRELLPHIQSGTLRLDAGADADANSKARLLGISKPLLTIPQAFDEVKKRVKLGWTVTDSSCPISGFPLLCSPDGNIMWSVRAQMPTMTRENHDERGQSKASSKTNSAKKTRIPIPDDDDATEKMVAAKASAVNLGKPLLSMKEAFDETSKRLLQGWILLNETCPVSNFPLLKSQDGRVVWSVRCQCEIATEEQATQRGLVEADGLASTASRATGTGTGTGYQGNNRYRNNGQQGNNYGGVVSVPLPASDAETENRVMAKASALDLGKSMLSTRAAFDETSKRLLQGWTLLNETCPISDFPLLRSPKGDIVWSVRCQCEITTEAQAKQRGLVDTKYDARSSPHDISSSSSTARSTIANDEDSLIYPTSAPSNTIDARRRAQKEAARSRQSALISQKLLQGWKMLSETCPETHSVPLMEEPRTGRKWSAATQKFVGETSTVEPPPVSPARSGTSDGSDFGSDPMSGMTGMKLSSSSYRSDQPAPESPIMQAQGRWQPPTAAEQREMEERQRRSDEWSQKMSRMLLQGWKMLDTLCPVTAEVPLMEHPQTGRLFSVATGTYVGEDASVPPQLQQAAETKTATFGRRGETKTAPNNSSNSSNSRHTLAPSPPTLELSSSINNGNIERQPSKRYIEMRRTEKDDEERMLSSSFATNSRATPARGGNRSSASVRSLQVKMEEARVTLDNLSIDQVGRCRELVEFVTACANGIKALRGMDQ
jgi:uncharacterized Zn finger protein (UPF0148 family)